MWFPVTKEPGVDCLLKNFHQPTESLMDCDGPRIFTVAIPADKNALWFVYQCDEEPEYASYFVRECTPAEVELVKANKIPLRDFLKEAPALFVVRDYGADKREMYRVNAEDFSDAHFPEKGVCLTRTQNETEEAL